MIIWNINKLIMCNFMKNIPNCLLKVDDSKRRKTHISPLLHAELKGTRIRIFFLKDSDVLLWQRTVSSPNVRGEFLFQTREKIPQCPIKIGNHFIFRQYIL